MSPSSLPIRLLRHLPHCHRCHLLHPFVFPIRLASPSLILSFSLTNHLFRCLIHLSSSLLTFRPFVRLRHSSLVFTIRSTSPLSSPFFWSVVVLLWYIVVSFGSVVVISHTPQLLSSTFCLSSHLQCNLHDLKVVIAFQFFLYCRSEGSQTSVFDCLGES